MTDTFTDRAGREIGAAATATLDLGDPATLDALFAHLPPALDHVLVSGGGPYYAPLAELDFDRARQSVDEHLLGALRATLPIRRVVGPEDVAAAVVHLMTNSAVTGATFDVDGGQQLIPW